jgi:hypothetical protein
MTAVALAAGALGAAEPKAAAKPDAPEKTAAESAPGDMPPTHKVKREVFKVELTAKGVFEAATAVEVVLRPEVWANLEVVKAVEHGQAVKRGELLIQCDLTKIDEEIADLRTKASLSELTLKQAEDNLRMLEASTPLDLKVADHAHQNAEEDLSRFLKIDRPMNEKMADYLVKMAAQMVEYEREELRQLEKMYKADELTEETEEIVLKRQRNSVEAAEFFAERARVLRDETLQIELPRRKETLEQNDQRQDLLNAKSKIVLPAAIEQQRRELAKLKLERAKEEERLKKLQADREVLTVRAPADGLAYYGRFVRGKWSGSEAVAESLRRGGSINKNAVVMTIVAVRPMFVRASVAEADLEKIRPGLGAAVRPTAYPDLKLPGTVARVDSVPSASDSFDARIDVKLDASDKRIASLVPGMSCTAKLLAYVDKRALVLPAKAVFEDELDEDSRYVFVAGKDGKPQKRPVVVGKKGDDKVEIIRGLTEQEEVLLERPKEKTLREEAKPKPADKKEAEKKEPPKKTVEPPKKEADKKDGAKDDRSKK